MLLAILMNFYFSPLRVREHVFVAIEANGEANDFLCNPEKIFTVPKVREPSSKTVSSRRYPPTGHKCLNPGLSSPQTYKEKYPCALSVLSTILEIE